jgi:hypothetical protein
MMCEILHPIFDALDDEFGFHGLDCDGELQTGQDSKMTDRQCSKFASH